MNKYSIVKALALLAAMIGAAAAALSGDYLTASGMIGAALSSFPSRLSSSGEATPSGELDRRANPIPNVSSNATGG